jgi:asparagine synthase (glutamine-hydrolysing)
MFCFIGGSAEIQLSSIGKIPELIPGKLYYQAPEKHQADSFIARRSSETLILEGILANASSLVTKYAAKNLEDLLWAALSDHSILSRLHGQYMLLHYNAQSGAFEAFTNVSNTVRLFYYHQNGMLIVSDKIRTIVRVLAEQGITVAIDELGARMILSYGYMLEGYTTIAGIHQVCSAGKLEYKDRSLKVSQYFSWNPDIVIRPKRQIHKELTELLSAAVQSAFARDEDLPHLAFLSGGLDSRLVVYTAVQLGFRDMLTLNFSEPGYLDATIANAIARELSLQLKFFSLAGGEYLLHLPENLAYHEGQNVLHGAAHLYRAIAELDTKNFGILHSGQIGDVIKGSYLSAAGHTPVNLHAAAYSTTIMSGYLEELKFIRDWYPNHEMFVLYNRGLNGMINGDLACYHKTHSLSPFLDPAFMQYAISIDPAYRYGSHCYLDWMKHSYPSAARHKWEKTGAPASDPYWLVKLKYNLWRGSDKLVRMITKRPNRLNMNPFDYWWQTNPDLREYIATEFESLANTRRAFSKELWDDLQILRQSPSFSERLQAYTLLKSTQYFFEVN